MYLCATQNSLFVLVSHLSRHVAPKGGDIFCENQVICIQGCHRIHRKQTVSDAIHVLHNLVEFTLLCWKPALIELFDLYHTNIKVSPRKVLDDLPFGPLRVDGHVIHVIHIPLFQLFSQVMTVKIDCLGATVVFPLRFVGLLGARPTGNARQQNVHIPLVRRTDRALDDLRVGSIQTQLIVLSRFHFKQETPPAHVFLKGVRVGVFNPIAGAKLDEGTPAAPILHEEEFLQDEFILARLRLKVERVGASAGFRFLLWRVVRRLHRRRRARGVQETALATDLQGQYAQKAKSNGDQHNTHGGWNLLGYSMWTDTVGDGKKV